MAKVERMSDLMFICSSPVFLLDCADGSQLDEKRIGASQVPHGESKSWYSSIHLPLFASHQAERLPMGPLCTQLVFLLTLYLALPASAQDRLRDPAAASGAAILPSSSPASLTGKERLGRKWMDEHRDDNCNVPTDKRRTNPRPTSSHHSPTPSIPLQTLRQNASCF